MKVVKPDTFMTPTKDYQTFQGHICSGGWTIVDGATQKNRYLPRFYLAVEATDGSNSNLAGWGCHR